MYRVFKMLRRAYAEVKGFLETWILWGFANSNIHPIFRNRLRAVCKHYGKKLKITGKGGFRTRKEQCQLRHNQLAGHNTTEAAAPGTSWHEFGCATDAESEWFENLSNHTLAPFGLCKPVANENWHVQPIETMARDKTFDWQKQFYDDYSAKPYKAADVKPFKCPICKKMIDRNGRTI